jgi:hypothetical protein
MAIVALSASPALARMVRCRDETAGAILIEGARDTVQFCPP